MTVKGSPPLVTASGEYGATTVQLSMDGSSLRIAFGRNGQGGTKVYHGAALLSPEAVNELKRQLTELESR